MATKYQDNLRHSLYNRNYINNSIYRNSKIREHELNNRVILNYSANKNVNNNMYSGYTNYTNGHPSSLIYQDAPLRSHVYNQGVNNRNDRLTQSVKSIKTVGGYLIPYEDIKIDIIKAKFGERVIGII